MLLSHHFWALYKCLVVTVYGDTQPSACILMFCLFQELFRMFLGGGGGAFPQPMTACRRGWEHHVAQRLDAVQTRESYGWGNSVKNRKYSPMRYNNKHIKLVPAREWISIWLSAAFKHWRRGWEEWCGVGLLSVGQVGAKQALVSLLNYYYYFSIRQI